MDLCEIAFRIRLLPLRLTVHPRRAIEDGRPVYEVPHEQEVAEVERHVQEDLAAIKVTKHLEDDDELWDAISHMIARDA
jgi:hypothetical protein